MHVATPGARGIAPSRGGTAGRGGFRAIRLARSGPIRRGPSPPPARQQALSSYAQNACSKIRCVLGKWLPRKWLPRKPLAKHAANL
jgi:hypothetical protein